MPNPIAPTATPHAAHQPSIAQLTKFLDDYWQSNHAERWKSDKHEDVLFKLNINDALRENLDPDCYGWKSSGLKTHYIALATIWYSLNVKGDRYLRVYRPKIILHELRKAIKEDDRPSP